MALTLSSHAADQAARRGLSVSMVMEVASQPEQVLVVGDDRQIRQSLVAFDHHIFLVRVVVDLLPGEELIVTVYRTGKIAKYWRED